MTTGAVSQPPIAAGEAAAGRSRDAGRKGGADTTSGGFSGMLSKVAGNREPDGSQSAPARDMSGSDGGSSSQLANWLRNRAEGLAGETGAADREQDLSGDAAGLTDIDVQALMQILGGNNGALAGPGGFAALAGRVADGTVTEAESAMLQAALTAQEDGETLSPEQLILARLAKASDQAADPANAEVRTTTALLTVLRRETHLGHVADGGMAWAARLAGEGSPLRAGPQPGNSGDAQLLRSADDAGLLEDAQPAAPHAAVTAVRDGQIGADGRRGPPPMAELQAAADALSGAGEQVAAAGRSDALVNTGLAAPLTQQIADRIATAAGAPAAQSARPGAPAFVVKQESAVKVLHIQLQPADMGVVTLRMSVKDNALRLDLEVGRGETANLIQRERETLSALLRSAGYMIDGLDVRVADQSGVQPGNSQGNLTPGGGQSGSSQPEARSHGERPRDERQNNSFGNGRHGEDEQAGHPARGGGIYI